MYYITHNQKDVNPKIKPFLPTKENPMPDLRPVLRSFLAFVESHPKAVVTVLECNWLAELHDIDLYTVDPVWGKGFMNHTMALHPNEEVIETVKMLLAKLVENNWSSFYDAGE